MLDGKTLGFIGGGQMCEAILAGALKNGGLDPSKVTVTDISGDRLAYMAERYGVNTALNDGANSGAVKLASACDILLLAVKPQFVRALLPDLAKNAARVQLVISIMGGVPLATLEEYFDKTPLVRVMPNTPMQVGKGVAGMATGKNAGEESLAIARALFEMVGAVHVLPEKMIDPLTALSGCGPAYAYLFIEALADGAVEKGLPRATALQLAAQCLSGAAEMVLQTGLHPAQLKDNVTSPGGGTIAGVHALESGGFRGTVMNAVTQSCERMEELALNT